MKQKVQEKDQRKKRDLKNPQQSERKIKLTKYEIARVIGGRALQLAYDAIPLVEPKPNETPIDIAKREFEEGLL
ncbi:MAG: DNA-directed RNA polymerase subunit omega, partial [Nitrososphaerota archaeon]